MREAVKDGLQVCGKTHCNAMKVVDRICAGGVSSALQKTTSQIAANGEASRGMIDLIGWAGPRGTSSHQRGTWGEI